MLEEAFVRSIENNREEWQTPVEICFVAICSCSPRKKISMHEGICKKALETDRNGNPKETGVICSNPKTKQEFFCTKNQQ
jgi:hypothetical protein